MPMLQDPLVPVSIAKTAGKKEAIDPFSIQSVTPSVFKSEWLEEDGAASAIETGGLDDCAPSDNEFGYPHSNSHD
jgi:hypothetical protein